MEWRTATQRGTAVATRTALLGLLVLAGWACTSAREPADMMTTSPYQALAEARLEAPIRYVPNADSTYMLCIKDVEATALDPHPNQPFLVVEMATDSVRYAEPRFQGSVAWDAPFVLRVSPMVGTVQQDRPGAGYRIDVRTGARVQANPSEQM